ncbi:carbon-nitrogen family hydrolase [Streptomyces sp. NBC_00178]|uniref:carbon-nitrogen family hydrolase n=1 Tax=Streptomyces sp. NBC_00178 TaxID=2975672 RepID=UPI002E2CFC73|nr:carbon-nitrogen family hydrolase [Streptomyces sp. NBC_00178]
MHASLIQIAANPDESINSRRERAASLVVAQRGADLVVLPELWPVGAFAYTAFEDAAEPLRGPTHDVMAKAAAEAGVWLHAGSFVERADDGTLYNTSLVLSPEGERVAAYRKIHRFGFDKGEAVMMGAGEELVTVALPETTLGLATCYDLRFPEQFRGLVDAGAEILVVPAGWPERRRAHWTLLAQARAVENQAYVLAVGSSGTNGGVEQAGHSIVVDPWGEVLAEAGAAEEVLTVEFDPARTATTREQFPALKDRRLGLAPPR